MNRPLFTKPVRLGLQQPEPVLVTVQDVWGDLPEPPAGGQRPSPTVLLLLRLGQAVEPWIRVSARDSGSLCDLNSVNISSIS